MNTCKTSICSCEDNTSTKIPSNMSVIDCDFSNINSNSNNIFKYQQELINKNGKTLLNPNILHKHDPYFNFNKNRNTYSNSDPRLHHVMSNTSLELDIPPLTSATKLNTLLTDNTLNCYGQGYKSYNDINSGSILYYIQKDTENILFKPLYTTQTDVIGSLYTDPMGSIKPQWDRVYDKNYNPIINNKSDVCSTFLRDSQFHREDLLSLQMRKINQQRYAPRYTN
jgi:hypothetical protein